MSNVRKRARTTSELEMAEEAAVLGAKKINAVLKGLSNDFKGAGAALKDVNRWLRLKNSENAAAGLALRTMRQLAKNRNT